MRVNQTSVNFRGNVVFVDNSLLLDRGRKPLKDHVTSELGTTYLDKVYNLVKNEPYNIYVSQSVTKEQTINIDVAKTYKEALLKNINSIALRTYEVKDNPRNIGSLLDVSRRAVDDYKKVIETKKSIANNMDHFVYTNYK